MKRVASSWTSEAAVAALAKSRALRRLHDLHMRSMSHVSGRQSNEPNGSESGSTDDAAAATSNAPALSPKSQRRLARVKARLLSTHEEPLETVLWDRESFPSPPTILGALSRDFPQLNSEEWGDRFDFGGVWINGKQPQDLNEALPEPPVRIEYRVPKKWPAKDMSQFYPAWNPNHMVYRNERSGLFVAFKPAGLATTSTRSQRVHNLRSYLESSDVFDGPVHCPSRLDCGTAGLVAAMCPPDNGNLLQSLFAKHQVRKYYLLHVGPPDPDASGDIPEESKDAGSQVAPVSAAPAPAAAAAAAGHARSVEELLDLAFAENNGAECDASAILIDEIGLNMGPNARTTRVDAPIGRDYLHPVLRQISRPTAEERAAMPKRDRPKNAVTDFVDLGGGLLLARPISGRTHQIRVHAAQGLNLPIKGDDFYCGADLPVEDPGNSEMSLPPIGGTRPPLLRLLAYALAIPAFGSGESRQEELILTVPPELMPPWARAALSKQTSDRNAS